MNYDEFFTYIPTTIEKYEKIKLYINLLTKWNAKINLISKNDITIIWQRHILDSAQLFKLILPNDNIVDIGSGNGMPAIILAILGVHNITLIETREKRTIFLQHAIGALGLKNAIVINDRVENLSLETDVIISRAFKDLVTTFDVCSNIKVNNKLLLLKGENVDTEILQAKQKWQFSHQKIPSIVNENSCILEIKGIKRLNT